MVEGEKQADTYNTGFKARGVPAEQGDAEWPGRDE